VQDFGRVYTAINIWAIELSDTQKANPEGKVLWEPLPEDVTSSILETVALTPTHLKHHHSKLVSLATALGILPVAALVRTMS
jgi:uncharacterized damage-inducible protein DinB